MASVVINQMLQGRGSAVLWPWGTHSEWKGVLTEATPVEISQWPHGERVSAKEQALEKMGCSPKYLHRE